MSVTAVVTLWVAVCLAAWKLGWCKYLRRRRLELVTKMEDCHARNACTLFVEFPFLYRAAFEFGLVRSAGIPAISRRVAKGGEVARNASKRYDDTDILIREMLLHPLHSDRGSLAVRRLNYLHSPYRILNDDYLYVLSLHILTVIEWASMYGYREWTELEKSTHYKVWHDIGTRMGMHDIPATLADLARFKEEFEMKYMVFADENHEVAKAAMKLLLSSIPALLQPLACKMVVSMFDDRLAASLGYSKQPSWLSCMSHALLKLHGLVVSWMPPRPLAWAQTRVPRSMPGCPFDPNRQLHLTFQCFRPFTYVQGYRIGEVGGLKPGKLSSLFEGSLLCPALQTTTTVKT